MSTISKRKIAFLFAFALMFLCMSVTVNATENTAIASGECGDNLTWTLDDAGCLTISGSGDMWQLRKDQVVYPGEVVCSWSDYENQIVSLVIEDGVEAVDFDIFEGYANLKKIYLGKNAHILDWLTNGIFFNCTGLDEYVVSEDNEYFMAYEGTLYSKDGEILWSYPASKQATSFTVLSTTKQIERGAIQYANYLEKVVLPEGLEYIYAYNMCYMDNLKEVIIPSSVVEVNTTYWTRFGEACYRLEKIENKSSGSFLLEVEEGITYWGNENGEKLEQIPESTTAYKYEKIENIYLQKDIQVAVGKTEQLYYEADYYSQEGVSFKKEPVYYTSSDTSVITIDENGKMTGVSEGAAIISVAPKSDPSNIKASTEIVVKKTENIDKIRVNGLLYELSKDGTASLVGSADYEEKICTIPSFVGYNNKDYPVVSVGKEAFANNQYIEDVVIENDSNQEYQIGAVAFQNCVNLKEITLPQNLKSIDTWAFANCEGLKTITLPDTVSYVGEGIFLDCTSIEKIEVAYTKNSCKLDELNKENIFCLDAIEGCTNLQVLQIPSEIATIYFTGRYNYTDLSKESIELTLMPNVRYLDKPKNSSVDITFFERMKKIHAYGGTSGDVCAAMYGVPFVSLGDVDEFLYSYKDLGNNQICLTGYHSYYGNNGSRDEVTIPAQIDGKKVVAIKGELVSEYEAHGTFENIYTIYKKIILPNTIKTIDTCAFYNMYVEDVVIPEGVETIKEKAFYYVGLLEDITVPNSVMTVEKEAFYSVNNLKKFTLSDNCAVYDNCIDQSWELEELHLPEHLMVGRFQNLDYDKITIYGYLNTPAEYLAEFYNIKFESIGQGNFQFLIDDYLYEETGEFYIGGYEGDEANIFVPSSYGSNKITGVSHIKTFTTDRKYTIELEEGITTYHVDALYKTSYTDIYFPKSLMTIIGHPSQGMPAYNSDSWTINIHAYGGSGAEKWIKEANDYYTYEYPQNIRYVYVDRSKDVSNIVPAKPHKIANVVSGVHVYWNAIDGAKKYGLWRSETGKNGTYKWIGNPSVAHFTDTKVESGKTYYYKVSVLNTVTNTHSDKSEAIGITYVATPDISSRVNKAAGIELGWKKITGATGYGIYRKSYSGNDAWVRIATINSGDILSYTDTSVKAKNGTIYKYTIRALAGKDNKTLSGCRNAGRTMVRLSSRTLNSVAKASKTSIKASWSTSSAVTGYEVRFMTGGDVYKTYTVGNYKTGTKTFTGLKSGKTYKVQVRAYKNVKGVGSFYSAWSEAKNVTLP